MLKRNIVRRIGTRVFVFTTDPHLTDADITIRRFEDEETAKETAARYFEDRSVSKVSDFFVAMPPIQKLGRVCADLRACGLNPIGTPAGHIIVKKDYNSTAILQCLDLDFVSDDAALDGIDQYYS